MEVNYVTALLDTRPVTYWNLTILALEKNHVHRKQGKYSLVKLTDNTEGL